MARPANAGLDDHALRSIIIYSRRTFPRQSSGQVVGRDLRKRYDIYDLPEEIYFKKIRIYFFEIHLVLNTKFIPMRTSG